MVLDHRLAKKPREATLLASRSMVGSTARPNREIFSGSAHPGAAWKPLADA